MVASGGLSTGNLPISKAFRVAISGDALLLVLTSEVIIAYSYGIPERTGRRAATFILRSLCILFFEEVNSVNHLNSFYNFVFRNEYTITTNLPNPSSLQGSYSIKPLPPDSG